jgi:hypothetical protein
MGRIHGLEHFAHNFFGVSFAQIDLCSMNLRPIFGLVEDFVTSCKTWHWFKDYIENADFDQVDKIVSWKKDFIRQRICWRFLFSAHLK